MDKYRFNELVISVLVAWKYLFSLTNKKSGLFGTVLEDYFKNHCLNCIDLIESLVFNSFWLINC
jgi:hypothetical protein